VEVVAGSAKERKEGNGPEDGPEGRPNQHQADAVGSVLRRVHVGASGPGQVHRSEPTAGQGHAQQKHR
jgi:hypothetical protein